MARTEQLHTVARKHGLKMITIADLIRYRMRNERLVQRMASPDLPTSMGKWKIHAFHFELEEADPRRARDGRTAVRRAGSRTRSLAVSDR